MSTQRPRAPFSRTERAGVVAVVVLVVGFAVLGVATGSPSTVGYVMSVLFAGGLVLWFRREQLPRWLVVGMVVDAAAHLAGGLVVVGDEVLYEYAIGPGALQTHLLQYDHVVHAYGSALATLALWVLLVPPELRASATGSTRANLVVLCAVAAFGIGAANELIEFLATLAHHGTHVGGYDNLGWDLVTNAVGAGIGAAILVVRRPPSAVTT